MRTTRRRAQGFTLIATLMMLLLLSGIAIGLMMMVNTEAKVNGADLQNNLAYRAAESGMEKMTSDLSGAYQQAQAPDICNLDSQPPAIAGVTWKEYSVRPSTGCPLVGAPPYGPIESGPNQGLWAQIVPITMMATADQLGGQQVSMMRTAQVALIPVFQFGVFSDNDVGFYSSPRLTFAGRIHTNADLYVGVSNSSQIIFKDKITAYGNVIRRKLPNGLDSTSYNNNGMVLIPKQSGGCDSEPPSGNSTCREFLLSEGSVQGMGGQPPQSALNTSWPNISTGSANYNGMILDGNWANKYGGNYGTGAKLLKMPFVGGGALPYEIIRRSTDADSNAVKQSREFEMAQIRVLLADDPDELPGGSADAENVRLANENTGGAPNRFGIATSVPNGLPALPVGYNYNTYFAAASTAIPDASSCGAAACPPINAKATQLRADWPAVPTAPPVGFETLVPALAPVTNAGPVRPGLDIALCPPVDVAAANRPAGCPSSGTVPYPYYVDPGAGAANWNLIDGWLRVEYRGNDGQWHGVTNEWLSLGFARGLTPPNAPQTNPVHPNAILIFQQPADRNNNGSYNAAIDINGIAPNCTRRTAGVCDRWTNPLPPEAQIESLVAGPGGGPSTRPEYASFKAGTTASQSVTRMNWYPINFYDAREGEPRDTKLANNSCTTAGVMNAVELDVGNLKKWLWGEIPGSGTNVDFAAQDGYILYFSDRRGMLKNPNLATPRKTGESGLEDVVNRGSAAGAPDGGLEPVPTGQQWSPEDVSQNGRLDSFGAKNLGLGFYNTNVPAGQPNQGYLNTQILAAAPDNPYTPRINYCGNTARKNWVSGARHVLKLVDAALGNVPLRKDKVNAGAPLAGGFTVASENPVYVQGDYNSNATDPIWNDPNPYDDIQKHANAGIIADAVTILSRNWKDWTSMTATPSDADTRLADNTYYRVAIAGGKNMNFPFPAWENGTNYAMGTDGGVHNFLRFLESWNGKTLNYTGSLVSLYYSTYNTGIFKCCTYSVYRPPVRNYTFDKDFANPYGMPPGTPMFRDVDTLSYRQIFATRDK